MDFNEVIPCTIIGDMVSNEDLTIIPPKSQQVCYTCGCRVSIYNPSKRCWPCRKKETNTNHEVLTEIFMEGREDENSI